MSETQAPQQQAVAVRKKSEDRTLSWFRPKSEREAWFFAQRFSETQLVPKSLRGKPADCFFVITHGAHLGMHPAEAVAKLHVVEGKIQMDATEIRNRVQAHEDFGWNPDRTEHGIFELTEDCDKNIAIIEVRKWWWPQAKVIVLKVTIEEAKESRWGMGYDPDTKRLETDWKPGSSWKKTPGDMLVARVTGRAARRYCPGFASAIYAIGEDFNDTDSEEVIELRQVQPVVQQKGEGKAAVFARAARAEDAVNGEQGEVIDATVTAAIEAEPADAAPEGPISAQQVKELADLCRGAKTKEDGKAAWKWLVAYVQAAGCDDVQGVPAAEFATVRAALLKRLEDGAPKES